MKKSHQYIIIGGIGIILLILVAKKLAISAVDLSQRGGGGGRQLAEGMMEQQKFQNCLKMNPGQVDFCEKMFPL